MDRSLPATPQKLAEARNQGIEPCTAAPRFAAAFLALGVYLWLTGPAQLTILSIRSEHLTSASRLPALTPHIRWLFGAIGTIAGASAGIHFILRRRIHSRPTAKSITSRTSVYYAPLVVVLLATATLGIGFRFVDAFWTLPTFSVSSGFLFAAHIGAALAFALSITVTAVYAIAHFRIRASLRMSRTEVAAELAQHARK